MAGTEGLNMLMRNLDSAYLCPLLATKNFKLVAEWAAALGHSWRARCLLQLGNIFKLQAQEAGASKSLSRPCHGGTTSCRPESRGKLLPSASSPGCRQLLPLSRLRKVPGGVYHCCHAAP